MQSGLLKPDKKLRFNEKHFQGYWVQLNTLIRRNDEADQILDGLLPHPMSTLRAAQLDNHAAKHLVCVSLGELYRSLNLGNPPGVLPSEGEVEADPIGCIRDFARATKNGTVGGPTPNGGTNWTTSRAHVRTVYAANLIYRVGCKHIWETVVATFSSAEATTLIAGLPYGCGPKLLAQVKSMQQRQTTMALFTLFSQLITLHLKSGEGIAGLYGRILEIRSRLSNWDPPIELPDKLIIVCMLRLLPRLFHAARTIIMTKDAITLKESKDMLLDVENRDAQRVAAAVGSKIAAKPEASALLTNVTKKKKKKKRPHPRNDPQKSAKYLSEGPCSHHGAKCGHASSECYFLHPELKPAAAVADDVKALTASTAKTIVSTAKPYGFLNNDWGYAIVCLIVLSTACSTSC